VKESQIGLLTATPIVVFACTLRARDGLSTTAAVSKILLSSGTAALRLQVTLKP
jgi:hypothetical protein